MAQKNEKTIVISENTRHDFRINPIITTADSASQISTEQLAIINKRKKVCSIYQSFQDNFKLAQMEERSKSAKKYSEKVQQKSKKPFWQKKNS